MGTGEWEGMVGGGVWRDTFGEMSVVSVEGWWDECGGMVG